MAVTVGSLGYKVLFECKLTSDPVKCTFKSDIWFSYPDFLQLVVGAKILGLSAHVQAWAQTLSRRGCFPKVKSAPACYVFRNSNFRAP